ncbi:hypothetical protein ZWY2020_049926 [Hordeum vulgare]|nr:hypothetical protein ZWY2020_049926 [Hordeum vulgare]
MENHEEQRGVSHPREPRPAAHTTRAQPPLPQSTVPPTRPMFLLQMSRWTLSIVGRPADSFAAATVTDQLIDIESSPFGETEEEETSLCQLNLIDLAGSESYTT